MMKYKNDGRVQVESNDSNKNLVDLVGETDTEFEQRKICFYESGVTISNTIDLTDIWSKFSPGSTDPFIIGIEVSVFGESIEESGPDSGKFIGTVTYNSTDGWEVFVDTIESPVISLSFSINSSGELTISGSGYATTKLFFMCTFTCIQK